MKIAISANKAWNIANFRAGLIRALQKAGYQVVALAPPDDHVSQLKSIGCRFVPVPMDNKGTNPVADAALFLRYYRILRREKPRAFLGYTIKPNIYGSLAAHMLSIPVINNVSGLGTAFIRDTWVTQIARLLYRVALRSSRKVFFQNEDDRQLFLDLKLVEVEKTGLLPGSGINLARFRPVENRKAKEHPFRFLLAARLLYDKGVGEYVAAARIVRRQRPHVTFALLGFLDAENPTAIPRREISRWVQEGIVEYLGTADDVRPYFAEADCIVLPSYREGTPRTLLEAAAMAKPIIATDVPGCREVVDHGRNGLLCKPKDAEDLARCMIEMIDTPASRRLAMGTAGRKKMENEFDENIVTAAYLDTLRSIYPH